MKGIINCPEMTSKPSEKLLNTSKFQFLAAISGKKICVFFQKLQYFTHIAHAYRKSHDPRLWYIIHLARHQFRDVAVGADAVGRWSTVDGGNFLDCIDLLLWRISGHNLLWRSSQCAGSKDVFMLVGRSANCKYMIPCL